MIVHLFSVHINPPRHYLLTCSFSSLQKNWFVVEESAHLWSTSTVNLSFDGSDHFESLRVESMYLKGDTRGTILMNHRGRHSQLLLTL